MTSSLRSSENSTLQSVEVSIRASRSLASSLQSWTAVHGEAPSRLPGELARALEALASHPYLGVAVGRKRRIELHISYFVFYRVYPRKRLVVITDIVHESQLHTVRTTPRR